MFIRRIPLMVAAALLAACGENDPTTPRAKSVASAIEARIDSVVNAASLFGGDDTGLRARVIVRNRSEESITITGCSEHLEARRSASQAWTNLGWVIAGFCPIRSETRIEPGAVGEIEAGGSATDYQKLGGADATAVIRARFLIRSPDGGQFVQSDEFTVSRR
jgi:hypothetical protein